MAWHWLVFVVVLLTVVAPGAGDSIRGLLTQRGTSSWWNFPRIPIPQLGKIPVSPSPPSPPPPAEMQQMGRGGCNSPLLDSRYVSGTLEEVKAKCLADSRCKVMVYHSTGSSLYAFCERSRRYADVWVKLEGPRNGMDLCATMSGCPWQLGPKCETSVGTCDPQTARCSAPLRKPDGTVCDDGDPFTSEDRCSSGICMGHERDCLRNPCPASSPCVSHYCNNPTAWSSPSFCVHSYNVGASCDEGNGKCDRLGKCVGGQYGSMTLDTSRKGCGSSTTNAACTAYGRTYGNIPACFEQCNSDPECKFVQAQEGMGGDCALHKECCSTGIKRMGQVYTKPM